MAVPVSARFQDEKWSHVGENQVVPTYWEATKPPGGGLGPVYVGQTSNKFSAATFQRHHLTLFSERLADRSGSLQLFFVVYPRNKETTKRNAEARVSETVKEDMRNMENRLIGLALKKNSDDPLNVQEKRRLRIEGVLDPERGQPSRPAVALKKTLSLEKALWTRARGRL